MAKLFKKPKTFEEGKELRNKFIEAFGEDGTFVIAFRVGSDLVSTLCGTKAELNAMLGTFKNQVDKIPD